MKDTDALIAELSAQTPPKRMASPAGLCLRWVLVSMSYVAFLLLAVFHPRPDIGVKLAEPLFTGEIVTLGLLALTTGFSATMLAFPDIYQKKWPRRAPLTGFALFLIVLCLEWLADKAAHPPQSHGVECCMAISFAAVPMAAWFFLRFRRMAPVYLTWAGSTALLASFSVGALALRLSEPTDSINHLICWHYLPILMASFVGIWLGQKILKW